MLYLRGYNVDIVAHNDNNLFRISADSLTPIRMILNGLKRPTHLKVRLVDLTI